MNISNNLQHVLLGIVIILSSLFLLLHTVGLVTKIGTPILIVLSLLIIALGAVKTGLFERFLNRTQTH